MAQAFKKRVEKVYRYRAHSGRGAADPTRERRPSGELARNVLINWTTCRRRERAAFPPRRPRPGALTGPRLYVVGVTVRR
ncbi:hypothetical protein EVAR_87829_1 [Eumeta japonica]|uniref:Uncharacterized protein n=1 Tax=Eumeta variegata TaxID=151549 RepID=A0A4C1YHZ7_EUMVA|nr:hypothetical protein EVAR_87829_1 [Eumeta japonica]